MAQPTPNSAPPFRWLGSRIERESASDPPSGVSSPRRSRSHSNGIETAMADAMKRKT